MTRLKSAGTATDTYDRYTFYRMLAELGTDSSADDGRLNLNYSNAVVQYDFRGLVTNITIVTGAETNLVLWTPTNFFHAAADQLLRTYTANWYAADTTSNKYWFTNTFAVTAPFSITNIPVWVSNRFVYTPAVHRLLQLAANLYDASTITNNGVANNLPHVFRPVFERNNNNDVFIVGYVPVISVTGTGDQQLAAPHFITDLSSFGFLNTPLNDGSGSVNVYGVPWIIGAKKGLPAFNQFYMTNTAQISRKLMFTRDHAGSPSASNPFTTNQMYVWSFNTGLGISFWNSYNTAYPRPVTIYASDALFATLTETNINGVVRSWTNNPVFLLNNSSSGYSLGPNQWSGSQWSGTSPSAYPNNMNSFQTANWSFSFLPSPTVFRFGPPYDSGGFPTEFDPTISPTGSLPENTSPQWAQLPQFGMAMTNYLQAYILDGPSSGPYNVIDYVQFRDPNVASDMNSALQDPTYPGHPDYYYQWSTNLWSSTTVPYGVYNQWYVSENYKLAPPAGGQWNTAPTPMGVTTPDAESAFFSAFFKPNGAFSYNGQQYFNTVTSMQAPYTPSRTVSTAYLLQANDPLVHYLASDLNGQNGAIAQWYHSTWPNGAWRHNDDLLNSPLPVVPPTPIGGRFQPWGWSAQMAGVPNADTNQYNMAYKDSLTWGPDTWDFPTNLYPSVGWIGRVHRGTPWQTVDLKASDILKEYIVQPSSNTTNYIGTNTWANWIGDALPWNAFDANNSYDPAYYANYFDAANAAPIQDRVLFDIFTSRLNDNAVHGTLPINQTHLAAWSALFGGMVVLTNTTMFPNASILPSYFATNISPAGVDAANSPLWALVNGANGINATRTLHQFVPVPGFHPCRGYFAGAGAHGTIAVPELEQFLSAAIRHQRRAV